MYLWVQLRLTVEVRYCTVVITALQYLNTPIALKARMCILPHEITSRNKLRIIAAPKNPSARRIWHINAYTHTYIHTHTNTYIHTHTHITQIHTYIHAYIHTYIHTHIIHKYIHTYIHIIHKYIHTYIHIIHKYIHTYIHTYICSVQPWTICSFLDRSWVDTILCKRRWFTT